MIRAVNALDVIIIIVIALVMRMMSDEYQTTAVGITVNYWISSNIAH